jgi:hypothetical protein
MSPELRKEFREAASHFVKFLNEHANPNSVVIVTTTDAKLLSGEVIVKIEEFILD